MSQSDIESHPFRPFLPKNARLLMLGTFPPAQKRWCMDFYYPNYQNDMWRIMGLSFFGDKTHFLLEDEKRFNLAAIIDFLEEKGIALFDTATRIRRTKNTASDKDLEIIEPTDLDALLKQLPHCQVVITAGQLATTLFCKHYDIKEPKVGQSTTFMWNERQISLFRMPSSSRAYPMKVERKTEIYEKAFEVIK